MELKWVTNGKMKCLLNYIETYSDKEELVIVCQQYWKMVSLNFQSNGNGQAEVILKENLCW